jgi:hypothetical protein
MVFLSPVLADTSGVHEVFGGFPCGLSFRKMFPLNQVLHIREFASVSEYLLDSVCLLFITPDGGRRT